MRNSNLNTKIRYFRNKLKKWYKENGRSFYWRKRPTPYIVLISEVFLKKTTAEYSHPFIQEFLGNYKSIESIRNAKLRNLNTYFKFLGLKNRARGLKRLACEIQDYHDGKVPDNLEDLKNLYLIGDYTANAVLCFAYNKRVPILDTNVIRIIGRFFGKHSDRKRPRNDRELWSFAKKILPAKEFKEYNWSLLDFGAIICKKKSPHCDICPLKRKCIYYKNTAY